MTTTTSTAPEEDRMHNSDDTLDAITRIVSDRRMATPALLYLTAHRPLAFATGQLLLVLEPLANLMGISAVGEAAQVLNDPHSLQRLQDALAVPNVRSASTHRSNNV